MARQASGERQRDGRNRDRLLEQGGQTTGVIPKDLADREVAFTGLADLRIVGLMNERKALRDRAFRWLHRTPGGLGTIKEFFEVLTWAQLGMHQKPCGLLNVRQYYAKFVGSVDYIVSQRFIEPEYRPVLLVDESPEALLAKFETCRPAEVNKTQRALQHLHQMTNSWPRI